MVGVDLVKLAPKARGDFERGVQLDAAGDPKGALGAYLQAFLAAPRDPIVRSTALTYLAQASGYTSLPPDLMTALDLCAKGADFNQRPLFRILATLIEQDARREPMAAALAQDDAAAVEAWLAQGHGDWLFTYPALKSALANATNPSVGVERLLVGLRRHLCVWTAQHAGTPSDLLSRHEAFVVALAQQAQLSRFAWPETDAEARDVAAIQGRDDAAAALVRAAYRPLRDFTHADTKTLPAALRKDWKDVRREVEIAAKLPQLTPISAGLSQAMQAQYEAFPYPRWRHSPTPERKLTLAGFLGASLPNQRLDPALAGATTALIAGCGTGQSILGVACTVPQTQFTGIDISRVSLAYAQRMAEQAGIKNVRFAQADILQLPTLPQRYHFIECGGVLHHMTDPAAGLSALRAILHPSGLLQFSVYSERGRQHVVAARQFVAENGFADSEAGMRDARQAIMALPEDHPARLIAWSADFFDLDSLHDLIFNVHEVRFTPVQAKQLAEQCGFRVVGAGRPPARWMGAFRAMFPNPADWDSLDALDAFEQQHPTVFSDMIKVWCRPAML